MFAEATEVLTTLCLTLILKCCSSWFPLPSLILETVITLAIKNLPLLSLITAREEETDLKGSVRERTFLLLCQKSKHDPVAHIASDSELTGLLGDVIH